MTTQTLSGYIKQLQEIEAAGNGHLPVCIFDEEDGWVAAKAEHEPYVGMHEYQDETCTRWSWKKGNIVIL